MAAFYKKKKFWGTLIALALLAVSFKGIRMEDLRSLSERLNLWYLAPALLLSIWMLIARGLRWRTIVEPHKKIRFRRAVPMYATGAAINFAMPALTGQVGRLLLFSRKEGLPKTFVFSTFLVEIALDAVMLFVFVVVSSLWFVYPEEYRSISNVILIAALVLLASIYLLSVFRKQVDGFCYRNFRERWPGLYITVKRFTLSFSRGVNALRSTKHLFSTLFMSAVVWVTHAVMAYAIFYAFGMNLPPAAAIVIVVVNTIALLVPITPGNAGTFELVVIATLTRAFGVSSTDAALYAVALHLIDVLPFFIVSLPFMRSEKVSITELSAEEETEEMKIAESQDDPALAVGGESK